MKRNTSFCGDYSHALSMEQAIVPLQHLVACDLTASCMTREVDSKTTSSSSLQNGQRIWKASATAKIPRNECPFTQRSATHLDRDPAGSLNLPIIFYPGFGQEVRARFLTTLTLFLELSKTPTYPFSRRWLVRNMNLYGWFYWKYRLELLDLFVQKPCKNQLGAQEFQRVHALYWNNFKSYLFCFVPSHAKSLKWSPVFLIVQEFKIEDFRVQL